MATDVDVPLLDDTIQQLPKDIRDDLAEQGRRNLYFFSKAILGYRDMAVGCHLPLCVFLDQHPSRFKLVLMPRGHFKTSVATIARVLQKVCIDPNQRILLANETTLNAERFLGAIREHVETNKVFRALYTDILPKTTKGAGSSWSTESLKFTRSWSGPEPTIDRIGMTGAMTSRHYTHITVDDPISEEAAKSSAVMMDTITRIDKLYSLMVKPEEDTFDLIGTRWALFDVYSFFMQKLGHRFAKFVRAAIKDGQPIFPELLSLDTLADIRNTMGEYAFSCLYMNNPRDIANQDFNVDDLKFWRWSSDHEDVVLYGRDWEIEEVVPVDKLDITVSIDLAVAEKVTSDRNAIVTCGQTPSGRIVVLDTFVQRCTPLQVMEHLFDLRKRFRPRAFGIEAVAYQKAFKYFLRAEAERRGEYLNIVELKATSSKRAIGNNSKEARIRGLQPLCATGRMYILPQMHILRQELSDFPLGEHDDCADALAYQLQMFRGVISEARQQRFKEVEQAVLHRIRFGDNPQYDAEEMDELIAQHRFGPVTDFVVQ